MSDTTAENVADRSHVAPDETARSSYADKIVQCPICDGTGKSSCADCKGIGKIKCDRCSGDGKIDCPVCGDGVGNHRGKVRKSRLKNCPNCNGTGRALVKELGGKRWADCCQCGGSGQVDDYYWDLCPNCHGDYEKIKACPDCDGKGEHECKSCHGEGMVICHVCKGKGKESIVSIKESILSIVKDHDASDVGLVVEKLGKELLKEIMVCNAAGVALHEFGAALHELGHFYIDCWNDLPGGNDENSRFRVLATECWHRGAELGCGEAQYDYADDCYWGDGCEKNKKAAREWFEKAAAQGESDGLDKLVCMYMTGDGGPVDLEKALDAFKKWHQVKRGNQYVQKHIELLPRIIKGDLDAMKKLHKYLMTRSKTLDPWEEEWRDYLKAEIEKHEKLTNQNVGTEHKTGQDATSQDVRTEHKTGKDTTSPAKEAPGKMIRETENRLPEKAEEKTDGNVAKTLEMSQESTPTTSRKDDAIANTSKDLPKSKPSAKPGSTFPSSKKRWLFVMIGLVFGLFGLQFVYAGRWKFFFAHWLSIIAGGAVFSVFLVVPLVLWFGSLLFMKCDGSGNRM